MGCCLSHGSADHPTSKLAIIDSEAGGLIREFPEHVKAEEILRERPGFFVCHADSMRYDEYVSPLSSEQELQVENLYFMLPVTTLSRPLHATDMAAMAVKASAAMERSRRRYGKFGRRHYCKITPSVIMMEQGGTGINNHGLLSSSSSSSWRGNFKGERYNSESLELKRAGVGLKARPVCRKLQRMASGRKRVNGSLKCPWRRQLSTIHEESLRSLLDAK